MASTSYQNDAKDAPFPSDGRSKWFQSIAETNHSPAMGARNGFDKLPKRSPRCAIPQRWVLKVDSKTYANDRKNEPLPSDGRSKWLRQVTKTMPKMSHSPAMGAQNGFKLSQTIQTFASLLEQLSFRFCREVIILDDSFSTVILEHFFITSRAAILQILLRSGHVEACEFFIIFVFAS